MASKELQDYVNHAKKLIENGQLDYSIADALYQASQVAMKTEKDNEYGLKVLSYAKYVCRQVVRREQNCSIWEIERFCFDNNCQVDIVNLFYKILKAESPFLFESYIFFMERRRHPTKRFYLPRRKTLKVVVDDLQRLEDTDLKFYGLSMPSRSGKSSTCIFFLSWIAYKRPNSHSAMGGHSGMLADGFYDELLNLMTTQEYCFAELYSELHPGCVLLADKSADKHIINLDKPDRFATITCRGIDGTWTGDIDISGGKAKKDAKTGKIDNDTANIGYLYVDDLVRDREHSLSPSRMENTWQEYLNKMVDRKIDGAKELMVGTLWNVLDPLERMRKEHEGEKGYLFRRIPALDENDKSNFDYAINGFSTEYYHEMRERLDNAEWMAKYQQQPYVREGIVFKADELRYFNGILPEGDHRIVAAVDVAWGGGDHLSMPIGAEYENGDVYIFDWVFSAEPKETTIPIVVGQIVNNNIRQIRFEGNTGGDMFQAYVDEQLEKMGYKCSTESRKAPNKMSKMEKIIAYSGDIKRKFVFLQSNKPLAKKKPGQYRRTTEYQQAMDEFVTFVKVGKNEHDDAVDGLTQLEMFLDSETDMPSVKACMNPFRSYGRA